MSFAKLEGQNGGAFCFGKEISFGEVIVSFSGSGSVCTLLNVASCVATISPSRSFGSVPVELVTGVPFVGDLVFINGFSTYPDFISKWVPCGMASEVPTF